MSDYKFARDKLLENKATEKTPEEYPAYLDGVFDMYNAIVKVERMKENKKELVNALS